MRCRIRLISCLFALAVAGCMIAERSLAQEPKWVPYSSDLGRFSVLLPVKPTYSKHVVKNATGDSDYHTHASEVGDGNIAFMVSHNDFPAAIKSGNVKDVLKGGMDGGLKSIGGKIVWQTWVTIDERHGLEFAIRSEQNGQPILYFTRIFVSDNRLYQLQIVQVGTARVSLDDSVRFLSSFKETKK